MVFNIDCLFGMVFIVMYFDFFLMFFGIDLVVVVMKLVVGFCSIFGMYFLVFVLKVENFVVCFINVEFEVICVKLLIFDGILCNVRLFLKGFMVMFLVFIEFYKFGFCVFKFFFGLLIIFFILIFFMMLWFVFSFFDEGGKVLENLL